MTLSCKGQGRLIKVVDLFYENYASTGTQVVGVNIRVKLFSQKEFKFQIQSLMQEVQSLMQEVWKGCLGKNSWKQFFRINV